MSTLREWIARLAGQFRPGRLERQTEEEMRFHLEMEVESGLSRGLSRQQAEREARLRAGTVGHAMENVRGQRGLGWLDGSLLDLRHAWAALRRQPGFLLAAGGALAAAVAINTLIFTIVYGVILRPLPYRQPERLVRLFEATPRNPKFPVSIFNYLEDKRESRTIESIALYTRQDLQLMHDERPERLTAVQITDDFLPTLGVTPTMGRNFLPSEMRGNARVVILSHTLWSTRFHSDPEIVGKPIRLNRETWTVAGVLPAGFQHVGGDYRSPLQGDTVSLWYPLGLDLRESGLRNWHFTNAIARLKPGISALVAAQDLNRIMDDLGRRFPDSYSKARARLEPLAGEVVGRSRLTVQIIVAAGALVLLVACINIAGLSVARVLARRKEFAIRQALGGGAWRLIRAALSESVICGALGGVLGLGLAATLLPVLRLILPADFPRLHEIGFSWTAGAFALATALLTALVAGVVPALRQIGADPRGGLSADGRMTSGGHRLSSLRGGLVAAEVALSCVLCFGAVLLARSSVLLGARDHGFESKGVLTFQLALPGAAYNKLEQLNAFTSGVVDRFRRIPGVKAAALTTNLPWAGYDENTDFGIVGRERRPGEIFQTRFQSADAGLLEALRLRVMRGRWVAPGDRAGAPPVVVINEAMARRYFDAQDPVGHYLDLWGAKRQIVGVIADVRDRPADAAAEPAIWWPLQQQPFSTLQAVLRTDGDPQSLISAARAAVASLDSELPLAEIRTLEESTAQALAERRFALWLAEAFAALAMILAAMGVYGMLAYLVEQRRREIAVRLALGATRQGLLGMILRNGLALAVAGIAAGCLIAPVAGRLLAKMLFGVSPGDLTMLAAAPAIMLVVSAAASLAPGWRAARTDPMTALREQ